jgi:DNA replication protein DnaC
LLRNFEPPSGSLCSGIGGSLYSGIPNNQQRLDFLEILEDRHGKNATIIASQIPVASWFDVIGEPTIADAILDRIIHTSHRIELKGESLRKKM